MPEPEPTGDIPTHGVHVIPGEVPEGIVPPSTSMTTPRPQDIPDEMVRAATGGYLGLEVRRVIANVWPEIRRQEREQTLRDLDAGVITAEDLAAAGLDPGHVVDLRADGWTIQHPLTCRTDLFACPVNRAAERDLTGPPHEFGRFECGVEDGEFWIGEAR